LGLHLTGGKKRQAKSGGGNNFSHRYLTVFCLDLPSDPPEKSS
jgi:hypothetical protein